MGIVKGESMTYLFRNIIFFGLGLFYNQCNSMGQDIFDIIKKEHPSAIDDSECLTPFKYEEKKDKDGNLEDLSYPDFFRNYAENQLYKKKSEAFTEVCDLIKKSKAFPIIPASLKMDAITREDLKIFNGGQQNPHACFANKINTTITLAGRATLCLHLAQPLTKTEALEERKSKLETFLTLHKNSQEQKANAPHLDTLKTYLQGVADGETAFLSFFDPTDTFTYYIQSKKTNLPFESKIAWVKKISNWVNDNPLYLTFQETGPALMSISSLGNDLFGRKGNTVIDFCKILGGAKNADPREYFNFFSGLGFALEQSGAIWALKLVTPAKFTKFLGLGAAAYGGAHRWDNAKQTYKGMADSLVIIKYMRKKLFHLAKTIRALKSTQSFLDQVSTNHGGKKLIDFRLPQTPQAKKLLELLETPTFAHDHDSLLSYWGRIKLAYKKMVECKDDFLPAYAAVGEIDFLRSSAQLIINNPAPLIRDSTQKAKYSLSTFIDAQTPSLKITNGWNTFIEEGQRVVLNNVALGVPIPGHPEGTKMIIMTGGNSQGKTAYMTMVPYAVLLSQGLGVVPAQELSHTPYNHLVTFMKTETDTSKGESLFRNTCRRGRVCRDTCRDGQGNKLFCGDEIYNGTKLTLGQSTVYKSLEEIGNMPNVHGIITTHLKAVTRLPASYSVKFMNLKATNHHIEPGIGDFETEEEGLRIIAQELGLPFANLVRDDIKQQAIYEYWEQQDRLDNLVQAARQEYQALRQQAGAPTLDGIIANITDPELRAALDQKINEPSLAGINSIIQRLSHPDFWKFFDLVGHVANVGQLSSEIQQQTFRELMLTIMAHCADATATAHGTPWLERIRQIEANIAQEHERCRQLQQQIDALQHVRNDEPLDDQLRSESRALTTITKRVDEKTAEIDSVKDELDLRQKLRKLQLDLSQQNIDFDQMIAETSRLIRSLHPQPQQNNS